MTRTIITIRKCLDAPHYNLTAFGKIGLGICYDLRFPAIALHQSYDAIIYPGAFNPVSGPTYWSLLLRGPSGTFSCIQFLNSTIARAVDAQAYTLGCSPARDESAGYTAYGHSLICSPDGVIQGEANHDEQIIHATLSMSSSVLSNIAEGKRSRDARTNKKLNSDFQATKTRCL